MLNLLTELLLVVLCHLLHHLVPVNAMSLAMKLRLNKISTMPHLHIPLKLLRKTSIYYDCSYFLIIFYFSNIQKELMEKGSITVSMTVYEDFDEYESG